MQSSVSEIRRRLLVLLLRAFVIVLVFILFVFYIHHRIFFDFLIDACPIPIR